MLIRFVYGKTRDMQCFQYNKFYLDFIFFREGSLGNPGTIQYCTVDIRFIYEVYPYKKT